MGTLKKQTGFYWQQTHEKWNKQTKTCGGWIEQKGGGGGQRMELYLVNPNWHYSVFVSLCNTDPKRKYPDNATEFGLLGTQVAT